MTGFRKSHWEPRKCPACGGRPVISEHQSAVEATVSIVARCHGSSERLDLDGLLFKSGIAPYANKINKWMSSLFKLDATPDLRELLAYNRGLLPGHDLS